MGKKLVNENKWSIERKINGKPLQAPEDMVRPKFAPMRRKDYESKDVFYENDKILVLHAPVCDSDKLFDALNHDPCDSEIYLSKLLARKEAEPMMVVSLDTEYQEHFSFVRTEFEENVDDDIFDDDTNEIFLNGNESVEKLGYRDVLSYQIAAYYNGAIKRFVFFSKTPELLSTDDILRVLCNVFSVKALRYPLPKNKKNIQTLEVAILAYNALADVSTFKDFPEMANTLVKSADLISRESYKTSFLKNNAYRYDCKIRIYGVMNHVPGGLKKLGQALQLPKIELPDDTISHMGAYRSEQFQKFLEYGINDSEICLLWYLLNFKDMQIPVSSPALGAKIVEDAITEGMDDEKAKKEAILEWRGLETRKKLDTSTWHNRPSYAQVDEVPFTHTTEKLLLSAANAYCGGMNQSMIQGFYDCETFDYDLCGCYPTAGSLLRDPDYMAECSVDLIYRKEMTMDIVEKYDYLTYGFGDVKFEFPDNIKFPCIAISDENRGLIFPRTSQYYVFATWIEVRCAILMGARVYANEFTFYGSKKDPEGNDVYTLRKAYKKMVNFRKNAKERYGSKDNPKPIQELIWKLASNGAYGKLAQNVKLKRSRDVRYDKTVEMMPSSITSPPHAAYITALPRVFLCSVMQQLSEKGFKNFSVTTDGFISNAPIEVLETCDGYGLAELFRKSREYLVNDSKVWECKHHQNYLLNITTRANVGFDNPDDCLVNPNVNVNAHVGFKLPKRSEVEKIQIPDESLFIHEYLNSGRNGVTVSNLILPNLNDVVRRKTDYVGGIATSHLKYNYDFKRKPNTGTMETVTFNFRGEEYEVTNFETEPYTNFEEYESYRDSKNRFNIIRTQEDYINVWIGSNEKSGKLPTLDAQMKAVIYNIRLQPEKRRVLDKAIAKTNLNFVIFMIKKTIRESLDRYMELHPGEIWIKGIETYEPNFLTARNWSNFARKERYNPNRHMGYSEWTERRVMICMDDIATGIIRLPEQNSKDNTDEKENIWE